MAKLQVKRFTAPDEKRPFQAHGSVSLLDFGENRGEGQAVGLGTFEPGWRWSDDVRPIAGTSSCEVAHELYVLSGRMHLKMNTGEEADIGPGDVVLIPPGHDAWVLGNETCRLVDFGGMQGYALPRTEAFQPAGLRPEEARH